MLLTQGIYNQDIGLYPWRAVMRILIHITTGSGAKSAEPVLNYTDLDPDEPKKPHPDPDSP